MKKCCPVFLTSLYSMSTETKTAMRQLSGIKHIKTFITILINRSSGSNPLHESRTLKISLSQMVKAINLNNY